MPNPPIKNTENRNLPCCVLLWKQPSEKQGATSHQTATSTMYSATLLTSSRSDTLSLPDSRRSLRVTATFIHVKSMPPDMLSSIKYCRHPTPKLKANTTDEKQMRHVLRRGTSFHFSPIFDNSTTCMRGGLSCLARCS